MTPRSILAELERLPVTLPADEGGRAECIATLVRCKKARGDEFDERAFAVKVAEPLKWAYELRKARGNATLDARHASPEPEQTPPFMPGLDDVYDEAPAPAGHVEPEPAPNDDGTLSPAQEAEFDKLYVRRADGTIVNAAAGPPTARVEPERAGGPAPRRRVRVSISERIRRARGMKHLPCGFPTIDRATRGGFVGGKLYVWIGQPGAAKTGTLCTIAVNYARAGYPVTILAADEQALGLATRFGQMLGFSREALDEREQGALDELQSAEERDLRTLTLFDAVDDEVSIEDAADELTERARSLGVPGILIVDSLQMAWLRENAPSDNRRETTDAKLRVLRRAAKTSGLHVHVTCEMSRAGYSSRNPNDRVDDIATGKESGGIEYAADVMISLRPSEGEEGIVDGAIPKNRLGTKPAFRLRLDFARATVEETERPKDDTSNVVVIEKLKSLLQGKEGRFGTIGDLAKASGVRKKLVGSAMRELQARGEALKTKGFYRLASDVAEPREPVPEPASAPGSRFPLRSRGTKGTRARRAGNASRPPRVASA